MKKGKNEVLKKLIVILIIAVAVVGALFGVLYIYGGFVSIANRSAEVAPTFFFIALAVFAGVGVLDGLFLCSYLKLIQLEKLNEAMRRGVSEEKDETNVH